MQSGVRWYVLANQRETLFYAEGSGRKFHLVEQLENPQARLPERELDSDRPGRAFSNGGGEIVRHALDRRHKRHEVLARRFASDVARRLESAWRSNQFGSLVLVAEPKFLGFLRGEISESVRKVIVHEVAREYQRHGREMGKDAELKAEILEAIEADSRH